MKAAPKYQPVALAKLYTLLASQQTSMNTQFAFEPILENIAMETAEASDVIRIEVKLFGKFEVAINDQAVNRWPSRKAKYLLAYLMYHHKRPQSRDVLIEKFWPHSTQESGRNSLNVAIHAIRKACKEVNPEHAYITYRNEYYHLDAELEIYTDVDHFQNSCAMARQMGELGDEEQMIEYLEHAREQCQEDFLEDNLYESWTSNIRAHCREKRLSILEQLSEYYSVHGELERSIDLYKAVLELDNCREDIHRRLMEVYLSVGKRTLAIRQFCQCREVLKEELGIEPEMETVQLFEQMKSQKKSDNFPT